MSHARTAYLSAPLFDFIGEIARADSSDELQARYLDGIGAFIASPTAGLYILSLFTHGAEEVAARGVSDFFLSRYEEAGRHRAPDPRRRVTDAVSRAQPPAHGA